MHGVAVAGSSNVYVSYSTPTTCSKSSFGGFGDNSWCYGRGVVQCIRELLNTHHMRHKLVGRVWTPFMVLRSWVVQCICELLRIHHMHQKLVWKFWTPFMVLQLRGRPMYM